MKLEITGGMGGIVFMCGSADVLTAQGISAEDHARGTSGNLPLTPSGSSAVILGFLAKDLITACL